MDTDTSQVASFYDQYPELEHARLEENPIEYAVTWGIIEQTLAKIQQTNTGPLQILDIGGGTGRYSVRLAKLGHHVSLTDISCRELDIAKRYALEECVALDQIVTADAKKISDSAELFKKSHYDMILCLGPFYHLLYNPERLQLLSNLPTLAKPGGYAHLRDVAKKDPGRPLRQKDFYSEYFDSGRYTKTMPMHHTNTAQIRGLFGQVPQLSIERVVGTESFLAGRMATELRGLSEDEFRQWAEIALRFAEDPDAAGAADHILVVARATNAGLFV